MDRYYKLQSPDKEDFEDCRIASSRLRDLYLDLEKRHLKLLDDYDYLQRKLETIKSLFSEVQSIVRKDNG